MEKLSTAMLRNQSKFVRLGVVVEFSL